MWFYLSLLYFFVLFVFYNYSESELVRQWRRCTDSGWVKGCYFSYWFPFLFGYFSEVRASFGVDLMALLFQSIKMSHEVFAGGGGVGGCGQGGSGRGESWGRRMLENDASVHSRLILSFIKSLALHSESNICSGLGFAALTRNARSPFLIVCAPIYRRSLCRSDSHNSWVLSG